MDRFEMNQKRCNLAFHERQRLAMLREKSRTKKH